MKKRFGKKKPGNSDMVLQITSMADIFTILLVFLLKSFSSGASTVSPMTDITLPDAKKAEEPTEIVKIEISRDSIMLDDKTVGNLTKFAVNPADLNADGTSKSLTEVFTKERQKDTLQKFPRMLVMADQAVPYRTIKTVLASAANSGFAEFKLMVVQDE